MVVDSSARGYSILSEILRTSFLDSASDSDDDDPEDDDEEDYDDDEL